MGAVRTVDPVGGGSVERSAIGPFALQRGGRGRGLGFAFGRVGQGHLGQAFGQTLQNDGLFAAGVGAAQTAGGAQFVVLVQADPIFVDRFITAALGDQQRHPVAVHCFSGVIDNVPADRLDIGLPGNLLEEFGVGGDASDLGGEIARAAGL